MTTTAAGERDQRRPTRASVLRERDFGLLFAGQAVSLLGDGIFLVAIPFAVLSIPGAGAADVGYVLGASALTTALFVLLGGVVADRLPRRATMLGSDAARGLIQTVGATLLLTHHATVAAMMVLTAAYGAAEAFFRPALLGLVPQVVTPGEEQPANALLSLCQSVGMVLAPAVAGVLVATVGPGGALVADAATFAVSAATLAFLRPRPGPPVERTGVLRELAEGWQAVIRRRWVWSTIVGFSAYQALVLPAVFVFGPAVSEAIRGGASSWGWISAGYGSGAVVGSIVATRWKPSRPDLVIGLTLLVASSQAVACASALPTVAVAGIEAVAGVCVALCFTVWDTALQQRIPGHLQSRVSSFDYLASLALMPLGYAIVGPVGDAIGLTTTAVAASVVSAVVCILTLLAKRSGAR